MDTDDLASWFDQGESGSLERYLEAFRHTVGVMQTPEALARVAHEAVMDLAADGTVYAELRFAPSLHLAQGLSRAEVIAAVLEGVAVGTAEAGIDAGVIIDAMRQDDDSMEVATAALDFQGRGVVGFDLAGPEAGFPPTDHLDACRAALAGGLHLTIHAGEADGPESMLAALEICGAERLGHGVRIVDDMTIANGAVAEMGPIAHRVHRDAVPLEVCPTSNLHTRAFPGPAEHPVGVLHRAGFTVTLSTDNRLMSRTRPTDEFAIAVDHHGFDRSDLLQVTLAAADAAFCPEDVRSRVRGRVAAGFAVQV